MTKGHPDWFKGIVLYGIGPEDEFIPIRTDELGNLHVGYGTHAITHQDGGSDEISCEGLEGILHLEQKSSWVKVSGKPTTFTPSAHKASHQDGGGDELSVAGLSGVLADEQPSSWALVTGKPTTFTPSAHKASHQNGGGDEISVAGLSGVLADSQTPASHGNTVHSPKMVEVDGTEPLTANWDIGAGKVIFAYGVRARTDGVLRLTDDSNHGIFVADGGKVGVGIEVPLEQLHVYESVTRNVIQMGSYGCVGSIYSSANYMFGNNTKPAPSGTEAMHIMMTHGSLGARAIQMGLLNNGIVFHTKSGSVTEGEVFDSPRMIVGNNGRVGINTLVPETDIDVHGSGWLRGNAGASLLHWSTTVTTSWQIANLSTIVGARVALVLIEIRNGTGSNHMYCLAPAANNAYYYSDTTWERGTAVAQVDNGMRNFVIAITASNGYLYLRSSTNHGNATDFYLVGFI